MSCQCSLIHAAGQRVKCHGCHPNLACYVPVESSAHSKAVDSWTPVPGSPDPPVIPESTFVQALCEQNELTWSVRDERACAIKLQRDQHAKAVSRNSCRQRKTLDCWIIFLRRIIQNFPVMLCSISCCPAAGTWRARSCPFIATQGSKILCMLV